MEVHQLLLVLRQFSILNVKTWDTARFMTLMLISLPFSTDNIIQTLEWHNIML